MQNHDILVQNELEISVFTLLDWVSSFLSGCVSRGLSRKTIQFYREKLDNFIDFCRKNEVFDVESVTTQDLRNYFTVLQANHSMGGVHCFFRSVRAFLNWYETENDDSGWKNTIKKVRVKAPYLEPLEPADIGAVKEILNTFIPNIICNFWIYSRQTIFTIFV